jgi:hypothetical protein
MEEGGDGSSVNSRRPDRLGARAADDQLRIADARDASAPAASPALAAGFCSMLDKTDDVEALEL